MASWRQRMGGGGWVQWSKTRRRAGWGVRGLFRIHKFACRSLCLATLI